MQHLNPKYIERAFLHPDCLMFADLLKKLNEETDLFPTRLRDMASALRRVAKALGLPPEDVPCDPRWLQPRLKEIAPAAHGLSPKSWQNVVSDARGALAHFGIVKRRHRRDTDLTPNWCALWKSVLASNDPTLPPSLSSFVYFLSRIGVAPGEVSDAVALDYKKGLEENEISRSPDRAYRAAVNGWNLAGARLVDWPQQKLTLPSRQKIVRLQSGVLPAAFDRELAGYLLSLGQVDILADEGRTRALRPSSIKLYGQLLSRFAAEAVNGGVDPSEITGLAALVIPKIAERGLRSMLEKHDNKTCQSIAQTAILLNSLAKALGSPEVELKQIARLAKKVSIPRQTGMTSKNMKRLRTLQNDTQIARMLSLPDVIFSRSKDQQKPHRYALAREEAVAIAILTHCPIRIANLSHIHLEHNVQRPGDGRAYLVFAAGEVKNRQPLEFELPKDVVRMIDRHLANRGPTLCPPGTPWLFSRRDGSDAIGPSELATRISRRVRKEIGLDVNAHLFRHFAVMLLLDAHPGSYESAGRLLGHSATSHTISVYSGMETRAAAKAFSDLVTSKKKRTS
jgi:integrase